MAAKNDITGDSIASRVNNKQYEDNYELIFGNKQIGRGMSTASSESLGSLNEPCEREQRINNVGQLEVYHKGEWCVKRTE
jgi:hypothetical protein